MGPGLVQAAETLKDFLQILFRHTRPVVFDTPENRSRFSYDRYQYGAAFLFSVSDAVGKQVIYDSFKGAFIHLHAVSHLCL